MKVKLTNVSPMQTAKVLAVVQFFAFLPFSICMLIPAIMIPGDKSSFPKVMFIMMPFIYLIFGFLFTLYGAWVYNKVAKRMGGIEFTTIESDMASKSSSDAI